MRKANNICIWAHSFQYLEWTSTTSLQFLNGPRGKPFRSNPNYDIIPYLKLYMMPMSVSMNFILRITYLNYFCESHYTNHEYVVQMPQQIQKS